MSGVRTEETSNWNLFRFNQRPLLKTKVRCFHHNFLLHFLRINEHLNNRLKMNYPLVTTAMPMQMPSYHVEQFKVFFGNQYLPDARWSDFKDLGEGYGKDGNHVFFMGQIMEYVHPFSFQVIGNAYAKDCQHVFQHGRIVEGLRPCDFQPFTNNNNRPMIMQPIQMPSYHVQQFKVFFGNQYLPDARWSDFKDLGEGYGKDGNHVFFMGQIMEYVHPFSFQVIGNAYAKDFQHIFQYGRIVEGLHPRGFQPPMNKNSGPMVMQPINLMYPMQLGMHLSATATQTTPYIVKDFKVFFGSEHIAGARWIDFTDLGHGYGKDGHHVFFMGQLVENAHPFSFEALANGYARDKRHVFQHGQILEGIEKPYHFQIPDTT